MRRDSEARVTLDAVLTDVNCRTLAALDRALPRSSADFLSVAVLDDERGRSQAACTATRLHKALCEPIRAVLDRGGKGWRSYTITAACEVVGGDFGPFDDWLALPELLHVGSLIVDDVEDDSLLRRGGPACHRLFGTALAINAGTFAYFAVQPLIERYPGPAATRAALYREYVSLLRAAHAGQGLDLFGLRPAPEATVPLVPAVLELHRLKSGLAFRAFARIGALLGGANDAQLHAVGEFFAAVGTAFQIIDDVLAVEGFEGATKTPLEDLAAGKITYPVALALDTLPPSQQAALLAALATGASGAASAARLLTEVDALTASRRAAHDLVATATEALTAVVAPSLALRRLLAFATRVLERVY